MNDTMKIEVVSRELIRPSSPTPNNLKTHCLSRFDQLFPPIYADLLLYYPNLDSNDSSLGYNEEDDRNMIFSVSSRNRCNVLRKSLSETLTRYYPFAGRIKDDKSVECNDAGVDYIEARVVGRTVSQVIQLASSDIEVMEPLLPFEPYGKAGSTLDLNSNALLKIQVNVLDCGGVVICLFYSHKIADGSSFLNFVADWAATARGGSGCKPCYMFSSMFPPTTCMSLRDQGKRYPRTKRTEIVTKRFVFKDSSVAKLKKKCIHDVNKANDNIIQVENQEQIMPTRLEALTSFIWMCFMDVDHRSKVKQIEDGVSALKEVLYAATISINLRTRTIPPLPANSFGNMNDVAVVQVSRNLTDNNGKGFHDLSQYLVSKIKDSIKFVDNEHVKSLQTNFEISCNKLKINRILREGTCNAQHKTTEGMWFSSMCRFPIYEADFGWGKPTWASTSKMPLQNLVMFMDTSSGDGIEAWVSLKYEDMVAFERHDELLAFAS